MLGAYLDRHYRGPAMVIAAAGAVDHDKLVELAGEAFRATPADMRPQTGGSHLSRRRAAASSAT